MTLPQTCEMAGRHTARTAVVGGTREDSKVVQDSSNNAEAVRHITLSLLGLSVSRFPAAGPSFRYAQVEASEIPFHNLDLSGT